MPKALLPEDLESSIRIIETFMREPMSLDGVTPAELLRRKRKRPAKKRRRPSADVERAPRRRKQAEEVQQYKSAQFIDDSDGDSEADAAFFAREAANREAHRYNISLGHAESSVDGLPGSEQRSRPRQDPVPHRSSSESLHGDSDSPQNRASESSVTGQAPGRQRPRPRARERQTRETATGPKVAADPASDHLNSGHNSDESLEDADTLQRARARVRKRILTTSSDEDEAE